MSSTPSAADAGQFRIGGDIEVDRLGFGAMRITGKGVWGEPRVLGAVERIDLWQLHRIDPQVRRDEQFGVIAAMQVQENVAAAQIVLDNEDFATLEAAGGESKMGRRRWGPRKSLHCVSFRETGGVEVHGSGECLLIAEKRRHVLAGRGLDGVE